MGFEFVLYYIAAIVVAFFIAMALMPRPQVENASAVSKMNVATVDGGIPIPTIFGTVWLGSPAIVWYGDLKSYPIEVCQSGGWGPFKKSTCQITGYWYSLGMHFLLCHGPVDLLHKIYIGEKEGWPAVSNTYEGDTSWAIGVWGYTNDSPDVPPPPPSYTDAATITINNRELFGGAKQEGGVDGTGWFYFGNGTADTNPYLANATGEPDYPAYPHLAHFVWNGILMANSPYPKNWAFLIQRNTRATGQDDSIAVINGSANPAYIILETLLNDVWGLGYSQQDVDIVQFNAVAQQLYNEGFGLNAAWHRNAPSGLDFINKILQIIDGVYYVDPYSGLLSIKLIRDDGKTPAELPQVDESNIIKLSKYETASFGDIVNEVTLVFVPTGYYRKDSVTVQNLGSISTQQAVINQTFDYQEIGDPDIAQRVAARILRYRSVPLSRIELEVNRSVWSLTVGDRFTFNWPKLGLSQVVYRIAEIDYGTKSDPRIKVKATQDVFSIDYATYTSSQPPLFQEPVAPPVPTDVDYYSEASYLEIRRLDNGDDIPANVPADSAIAVAFPITPQNGITNAYCELQKNSDGFKFEVNSPLGFRVVLPDPLGIEQVSSVAIDTSVYPTFALNVDPDGMLGYINGEIVKVRSLDLLNNTATLDRGIADTIPVEHPAGSELYISNSAHVLQLYDNTLVTDDPTYQVRYITNSTSGSIAVADAAIRSIDFTPVTQARYMKPYPPGDFRLNGTVYAKGFQGNLDATLSWAERNRLTQAGTIVLQSGATVAPEANTTYTVKATQQVGGGVASYAALIGTSFAVPNADLLFYSSASEAANNETIAGVTGASGLNAAILADNPINYWKLTEGAYSNGSYMPNAITPTATNGLQATGDTGTPPASTQVNPAAPEIVKDAVYSFEFKDGNDATNMLYASAGNAVSSSAPAYTLELMFLPLVPTAGGVFSWGRTAYKDNTVWFNLSSGGGGTLYFSSNYNKNYTVPAGTVIVGAVNHLVLVVDTSSSLADFYCNGSLIVSGMDVSGAFSTSYLNELAVGNRTSASFDYGVVGRFSHVAIYEKALTQADIDKRVAALGSTRKIIEPSVEFSIYATRDGYQSHQTHKFVSEPEGYGYNYGNNYGGTA